MLTAFGPTFPRLFAAAILQELSFFLMVHVPGYFEDLGVSESTFGLLYGGAALAALALRPAFGRLLDLRHRRSVLLGAGALNVFFVLLLIGTSVWGPFLWIVFVAHRILLIGLFTAMLTYAADAIPEQRRTQGLAIFGLSGLFSIAIGGLLGDVVIEAVGFDGLFLASAMVGLISWGIVWTFPLLDIRGPSPRRGFFQALKQKNLLPIWWITLSFSIGLETLFSFTRTFVDERQVGSTGLFFGIYGVSAAATRIVGGRSYDRIPRRPLVLASIAGYGLALILLAQAQEVPMFASAAVLAGVGHGVVFPVLSSSVVYRSRVAERGSAFSIFTSIFDIALLFSAPVVGGLIDGISYTFAFSSVGGFLVFGGLVYWLWDKRMVESGAMVGVGS